MATPVVIAANGRGIPVVPVETLGASAIIAENGKGIPIVISTRGVPMIISGYTP
jgi:hypothetical protein